MTIIKKTCGLIGTDREKLPEQYKPAELRRFERYNVPTNFPTKAFISGKCTLFFGKVSNLLNFLSENLLYSKKLILFINLSNFSQYFESLVF